MAGPPASHSEFAVGETLAVDGLTITLDQTSAGVDVLVEIVDLATGLTVETLLDAAKDFTADEARSLDDLGASNYLCATAGEFCLRRSISGGAPAIESESSDYGFTVEAPAVAPDAPSWGSPPTTPGDGQMTLAVLAAAPGDVIYARHRPFLSTGAWSAESETFKRTGSGNIVITGITNEQYREYTFYAKSGNLTSDWAQPKCAAATDGDSAQIDQIMEAVAAQINLMGLASKTEAGAPVAVAAEVEIPPNFESVNVPCVKVFPDTEEAEAVRSKNDITVRVNVAFCQRSKTTVQQGEQFRIREKLRDQFLGKRLVALPSVICIGETESGILDMESLAERFQWISPLTLEFSGLKART